MPGILVFPAQTVSSTNFTSSAALVPPAAQDTSPTAYYRLPALDEDDAVYGDYRARGFNLTLSGQGDLGDKLEAMVVGWRRCIDLGPPLDIVEFRPLYVLHFEGTLGRQGVSGGYTTAARFAKTVALKQVPGLGLTGLPDGTVVVHNPANEDGEAFVTIADVSHIVHGWTFQMRVNVDSTWASEGNILIHPVL